MENTLKVDSMSKITQLTIALITIIFFVGMVKIPSANVKAAVGINGEVIKTVQISSSDIPRTIEVSAIFGTDYHPYIERHLFSNLQDVSTQLSGIVGTWKQTDFQASLIDGGTTYNISIKGVYTINGESFEEAFSIEFYCDAMGQIF